MVVVLASLALKVPSRYTRANDLYWIFGWYVVGKLFEAFDAPACQVAAAVRLRGRRDRADAQHANRADEASSHYRSRLNVHRR